MMMMNKSAFVHVTIQMQTDRFVFGKILPFMYFQFKCPQMDFNNKIK